MLLPPVSNNSHLIFSRVYFGNRRSIAHPFLTSHPSGWCAHDSCRHEPPGVIGTRLAACAALQEVSQAVGRPESPDLREEESDGQAVLP